MPTPTARHLLWALAIVGASAAMLALAEHGYLSDILVYRREIVHLTKQHAALVAMSGGPAIVIGVLLGIVLSRPSMRRLAELSMQVLNVGATIPTLALIALSMTVLGIGQLPALFALFIHALLPIVRNTYAGLRSLPQHLLEAACGMGMTPMQILCRVELPNALYVIMTGIRTAMVINVGVAPLAFLVGGGGLGDLIFSGIYLFEPAMMLAGAIPTGLFAVTVDVLLLGLTTLLVSRGVSPRRENY